MIVEEHLSPKHVNDFRPPIPHEEEVTSIKTMDVKRLVMKQ